MVAVPLTLPVLVLKVHEDVTAVAVSPTRPVSAALGLATLVDALVGPAVSVTTPVVSIPVMLACATVTGEVPG
jgi:hypothetical protein